MKAQRSYSLQYLEIGCREFSKNLDKWMEGTCKVSSHQDNALTK
jgi:hypothetical protein